MWGCGGVGLWGALVLGRCAGLGVGCFEGWVVDGARAFWKDDVVKYIAEFRIVECFCR